MKLCNAAKLFFREIAGSGIKSITLEWYERRLKTLTDSFGESDVRSITADDLRQHCSIRQTLDAPWTYHGRVRALRRLFRWLAESGRTRNNPAARIRPPRIKHNQPRSMLIEDLRRIRLAAADNPEYSAIISVLSSTGCRVGGLITLRWENVDLKNAQAVITEKGNKTRVAFLDRNAVRALRQLPRGGEFVFTGKRGCKHMRGDSVSHILKMLARKAGVIGRCNPHSIRHLFAKEYLLHGGDLKSLSNLLGHETFSITADFYGHFETANLQYLHRKHARLNSS